MSRDYIVVTNGLLLAAEEYQHGKLKVGETDGKPGYDKWSEG